MTAAVRDDMPEEVADRIGRLLAEDIRAQQERDEQRAEAS